MKIKDLFDSLRFNKLFVEKLEVVWEVCKNIIKCIIGVNDCKINDDVK